MSISPANIPKQSVIMNFWYKCSLESFAEPVREETRSPPGHLLLF